MRRLGVVALLWQLCALKANDRNSEMNETLGETHGSSTSQFFSTTSATWTVTSTQNKKLPVCKEKNTCLGYDCNFWITRGCGGQYIYIALYVAIVIVVIVVMVVRALIVVMVVIVVIAVIAVIVAIAVIAVILLLLLFVFHLFVFSFSP